jgi:uncharacterized membrane protein YkvI
LLDHVATGRGAIGNGVHVFLESYTVVVILCYIRSSCSDRQVDGMHSWKWRRASVGMEGQRLAVASLLLVRLIERHANDGDSRLAVARISFVMTLIALETRTFVS